MLTKLKGWLFYIHHNSGDWSFEEHIISLFYTSSSWDVSYDSFMFGILLWLEKNDEIGQSARAISIVDSITLLPL